MPASIYNWISNENKSIKKNGTLKKSGYSTIFIQLLANKNLTDIKEIHAYLKPSLKDLHGPELLPNLEAATERIKKTIANKERVLIFGDYDTDGIISTAMLYNFLKKLDIVADFYIPDRFSEGYDINIGLIKKNRIEEKYDLVICVDCGSNAVDVQAQVLSGKLGIDVIACDHHEVTSKDKKNFFNNNIDNLKNYKSGQKSNCYIVINPKYPGSKYPFKMLSGGGVTFKFIWSIMKSTGLPKVEPRVFLKNLLDLVAITTIADLMPLIDENRVMVSKGLKVLKNTVNAGLKKLIENVLEDRQEINTYDIGFLLSPRLNASGRMDYAGDSLKILLDDNSYDEKEIEAFILKLNNYNTERKKLQQSILNEIEGSVDFDEIKKNQKVFISKSTDWSEGVLGVVASDIVKKYSMPAILFKDRKGILKGSCRSIESFDMHKNLELLKKYFTKFGGHSLACGITMPVENYDSFRKEFFDITASKIDEEELIKRFYYDLEISFKDIDLNLLNEIRLMEPFGPGNHKPVFLTQKCMIISDISCSKNGKHAFFQIKNSNRIFSAAVFNYMDSERYAELLLRGSSIDILYNLESYKSKNKIQAGIKIIIQSFR